MNVLVIIFCILATIKQCKTFRFTNINNRHINRQLFDPKNKHHLISKEPSRNQFQILKSTFRTDRDTIPSTYNVANMLTISRIVVIPFFMLALVMQQVTLTI